MPLDIPESMKSLVKNLVSTSVPTVAEGVLLELLRDATVKKTCQWVEENKGLWDTVPLQKRERIKELAKKYISPSDKLEWMGVDWAMHAIKVEYPALTSLFLGWRKGRNWLGRQIEIIKKEIRE